MNLRDRNIERLKSTQFDVLIIGGGINGAVSAAALAARGANVALIDRADFASGSSSASSNLAWGGIKYLESYEFGLVNKLCKSRNQLMESYPANVREIRFLTTISKGFRYPVFLVYLSTLLYWVLGRFATRAPRYFTRASLKRRQARIDTRDAMGGFEYSDSYLPDNDARFVFSFVRSAMDRGAVAANYVSSLGSRLDGVHWTTDVIDEETGDAFRIRSSVVINACGAHADAQNALAGQSTAHRHLFSKGIHLVVDRIVDAAEILAFFASDGRLFFVITMGSKTCIGTTDTQVESPETVVTDEDRTFVLDNANACLNLVRPLTQNDIIAERCGVRPLAVQGRGGVADWVKLSRKHAIDVDREKAHISIFGGKLTDCINVGEEICEVVQDLGIELPSPKTIWFGEPGGAEKAAFMTLAKEVDLDSHTPEGAREPLSVKLWRRYGERARLLLGDIQESAKAAQEVIPGSGYLRCEVSYAAHREMVTRLDDFLRRRTELSLVTPSSLLLHRDSLTEIGRLLFGAEGDQRVADYLDRIETKDRYLEPPQLTGT
ncbi:MAG: FAD-dependent oxidoreductase [Pseudomonadota bacterium]